jgi:hypothetical protein
MIPVVILFFLIGAVLAPGFRVWVLVPITFLATLGVMIIELALGASIPATIGYSMLLGAAPQLGYALGLLTRYALVVLRWRRRSSVALLFKRRAIDHVF